MVTQRILAQVSLDQIDDNPYNPRQHYPRNKVNELAESIKMHGLLELPKARPKGGRYQLAFGSMRKRAYEKLAKEDSEKWGVMPLELAEITDDEMFYYAIEENLKRADLTPIEIARGIDAFLGKVEITEKKAIKEALEMTKSLGRPQMNLILLAELKGQYASYYGSSKSPSKWLWDRLSAGRPSDKRTDDELWRILDRQSDEEIARLITEMMFASLTYSGDNLQDYEIRTAKPLKWFGIEIPIGEVPNGQS